MPDREQPVDDPQLPAPEVSLPTLFRFRTAAERAAFARGVQYVNDSAIRLGRRSKDRHRTKPYVIAVHDREA